MFNSSSSSHIHTPPLFHVELEKDGWEYVDMLWLQGAQIGLFIHKVKSALIAPYNHNARWARGTDRQTDGRTNIMAIARRFVLTNASRARHILSGLSPRQGLLTLLNRAVGTSASVHRRCYFVFVMWAERWYAHARWGSSCRSNRQHPRLRQYSYQTASVAAWRYICRWFSRSWSSL